MNDEVIEEVEYVEEPCFFPDADWAEPNYLA